MEKFCKDCIHYQYRESGRGITAHICSLYSCYKSDIVTGKTISYAIYCIEGRTKENYCGPESKNWESTTIAVVDEAIETKENLYLTELQAIKNLCLVVGMVVTLNIVIYASGLTDYVVNLLRSIKN